MSTPTVSDFSSDIPLSLAIAAYNGTSHSPESRGAHIIKDYAANLQATYDVLARAAAAGHTLDQLAGEFERFRAGFKTRYLAWLSSRSRCISAFIAGPSNFPVRRAEKRNNIADRRLNELVEFQQRARSAACRNLRPDLRPIMAGDADAIERLEMEIAKAEQLQARMKDTNAAIRKHRKAGAAAQVGALVEMGYSDGLAQKLLQADCCGRIGFADYSLTNNNANIRRMKQRLAQISAAKALPETSKAGSNGVRLEDSPADNRVRLAFPGKPSDEIRTTLKRHGFRWTPSLGVWQAYRNSTSLQVAAQLVQS